MYVVYYLLLIDDTSLVLIGLLLTLYCMYRVAALKLDKVQIWLLIKNPQFFFEYHETWSILPLHEYIILTKFHNVRRKIVDFLLVAKFEPCPTSEWPPCKTKSRILESARGHCLAPPGRRQRITL